MAKNKRINKLGIFFTVAIVEMVLVAGFFGYKTYLFIGNMKILNKETVVLKQKTANAAVAVDIERENEKVVQEMSGLKDKFFDDTSLLYFLKDFATIASAYGISINSIGFGGLQKVADTVPPIKGLPVNMSISGSFDSLIKFLSYLEKYKYFVVPENLSAGGISETGRKARGMSISLTFYVQTLSKGAWSYGGK